MPNVLESLVIQLGLDTKGVSTAAQGAENQIKKVETSADRASDALDKNLSPALDSAAGKLTDVSGGAEKTANAIDDKLAPAADAVSGKIKQVGDSAGKTAGTIDSRLKPAVDASGKSASDASEKLDAAAGAMDKTGQTAQSSGKKIRDGLADASNDASSAVDDLSTSLEGAGKTSKTAGDGLSNAGKGAKNLRDRLEKNLSPASQKANEQLRALGKTGDGVGKSLADGFSKARNQALALMAVFTAGRSIGSFIEHTTEANAQLGFSAQRLNVNPQQLWTANHAVEAMGGSEGEVSSALSNIQQMQTTPEGAARLSNVMGQLGVRNYQEDIKNGPDALMRDINRVTQGMDQGRKNNLLGQLGFGPGMINTVNQTTSSFDKLIASKKGLAPTNSEISNSQKLMADFQQFADVNDHFARVLENEVAPAIDKVLTGITKWEQENGDWVKGIIVATTAVTGLGTALAGIVAAKGAFNLVRGILKPGSAVSKAASLPGSCCCSGGGGAGELPLGEAPSQKEAGRTGARTAAGSTAKIGESRASGLIGEAGTYLSKGADAGGFVFRKWALRAGLRAIPFIGAAADLYGGSLNEGEGKTLERLKSRGDEANYQDVFAATVGNIESKGRYDAVGGAGNNYFGKYQLSRDVISDAAKKLKESTPSTQQFLADPKMQDRYFAAFTEQNKSYLDSHSAAFRNMSKAQQYAVLGYAHNQGAGGALKWLNGGDVGHDAFGTAGTRYSDEFLSNISKGKMESGGAGKKPLDYNGAVKVVRSVSDTNGNNSGGMLAQVSPSVPQYSSAIKSATQAPAQTTNHSTNNSTTVGDLHITVNTGHGANGAQVARDIHAELKRILPIQNIYGQA